jgi:hypothetical protein
MLKQIEERLEAGVAARDEAFNEKAEGKILAVKISPTMEIDIETAMKRHRLNSKRAVVRRAIFLGLRQMLR